MWFPRNARDFCILLYLRMKPLHIAHMDKASIKNAHVDPPDRIEGHRDVTLRASVKSYHIEESIPFALTLMVNLRIRPEKAGFYQMS